MLFDKHTSRLLSGTSRELKSYLLQHKLKKLKWKKSRFFNSKLWKTSSIPSRGARAPSLYHKTSEDPNVQGILRTSELVRHFKRYRPSSYKKNSEIRNFWSAQDKNVHSARTTKNRKPAIVAFERAENSTLVTTKNHPKRLGRSEVTSQTRKTISSKIHHPRPKFFVVQTIVHNFWSTSPIPLIFEPH